MRAFFNGWRRKMGIVTLAIALLLMAGWMRSLSYDDDLKILIGQSRAFEFYSGDHRVTLICLTANKGNPLTVVKRHDGAVYLIDPKRWIEWNSVPVMGSGPYDGFPKARWYCNTSGVRCGVEVIGYYWQAIFMVPYFACVVPLTLLSAYLLFSKPQVEKSK